MAEDQQFYVGQKAVIERDGQVLVLFDPLMGLDLPGGKIQVGETDFPEALRREVREEANLEIEILNPIHTGLFQFPENIAHRNAGRRIFIVFYAARPTTSDLCLSHEHDRFQWVDAQSYRQLEHEGGNDNIIYRTLQVYFSR